MRPYVALAALLVVSCSLAATTSPPSGTAAPTIGPTTGPTLACGPLSPECIGTPGPPTPPPTPRPTRTFESADFLITRVGDDVFLVDPYGLALYTRDADPPGESECYGGCAIQWPPVTLLPGETARVKPARLGQMGEFIRTDGSRQITFDGKPVYYYYGDTEGLTAHAMCQEGWSLITPLLVEPLCP